MILVYLGYEPDVWEGDYVYVTGPTTVYFGAKQFGSDSEITYVEWDSISYPEPEILTLEQLNAYATATQVDVKYITLTGKLAISGNYYNFNITGDPAIMGSLTYPDEEQKEEWDALVGATIQVCGYITGVSGGGKYLNVMVVEIQAIDEPVAPPTPGESEDPTPSDNVITNAGVEIKEGVAYLMSMNQVNNGHVVYVCGGIDQDRYLITSEDKAAALKVYVEKNGDGYNFYTTIDGAKKYINVTTNANGKVAILYEDAATSTYTYVSETNIWKTVLDGKDKYIGSYNNFDTMSASDTSYINAGNTGVKQFPMELVLY